MYVRDTALVQILCQVGIPHGRAVRIERAVDDQTPCLLSSDALADLILRYARFVAFRSIREFEAGDASQRKETTTRLELFERSAYGVFSPQPSLMDPQAGGTSRASR